MSDLAKRCNAINLSQGFPNYSSQPKLFDLVNRYMHEGFNQYAPLNGVETLRQVIAQKIGKLYQRKIDIDKEICITAGATQAVYTAIQMMVHPGDEVIIFDPAFDIYAPAVKMAGGKIVRIPTHYPNFDIDWDRVNDAINSKTQLIIINSPNNPTGKTLSPDDILALELIVKQNDLFILSDEVYEHMVFDGRKHHSILSSSILYNRSIVTFSFGKTFHNTGWKVGYAVGPDYLMSEFKKLHQFIVFSVNTPVQYALADYLLEEKHYNHLSEDYQTKRDQFLDLLQDTRFRFLPTNGTYFQLLDYAEISNLSDMEFAIELTQKHGIATIPLSPFYEKPTEQKLIRVCFAKTPDVLIAAAEKLCKI
ncbi:MAG: aminotransferase class I/II-fold pyridoxal phosphate-dependent enzyme [Bacteroidetes bacterium]|nr:aminotransferase class I/II-fold pyridoxal phosphate-dependent enzyme [Bacteroidota bacterium]